MRFDWSFQPFSENDQCPTVNSSAEVLKFAHYVPAATKDATKAMGVAKS